ncbi:RING/U-box superfamily protein [Raphanus sativus]|uniref:RING-type E3 ubiquitin transferase n=1 Tax=Raphanus sativus TaxID=3726 RepID=A0A9W3CN96_RAPSA|nr:RING-H2 finger protein ATL79-like [Raphanus sativus]KAJ4872094.1 RING/U-box superfamily protein [Raphanus sativus]
MRLLSSEPQVNSTCESQSCSWKPYSHPNDFAANASILLIIIFSSLICVLSLQAALRCCLRPVLQEDPKPDPDPEISRSEAFPVLFYSPGLNLAGTECIICLSEFEEGDSIRVLDRCKHGFHVHCIQQWFSSNSSCPTCRTDISSSPTGTT